MAEYYRHPTAVVETEAIGEGTRIWAFAHVLPGATIGRDCNIGDHCYVESGVRIGDRVTLKNGVAIWDGVTIGDGAFLGPSVALTNDLRPRSGARDWTLSPTRIEEGASVGANVTLLCGITVGAFSMVGAGSVVTRDVPRHALVYGNPARVRGWVCRCGENLRRRGAGATCPKCGMAFVRRGDHLLPAVAMTPR